MEVPTFDSFLIHLKDNSETVATHISETFFTDELHIFNLSSKSDEEMNLLYMEIVKLANHLSVQAFYALLEQYHIWLSQNL